MTATQTTPLLGESAVENQHEAAIDLAEMPTSRKALRTPGQRIARGIRAALPPLAVFLVVIAAWYAANAILGKGRNFLLPRPDEVITTGFLSQSGSDILIAVGRTTTVAITGLAIACVLGIAWAVAMSMARWFQRSTYPYAVILQCIPILALVPLIGVWFGYEFNARVIVCVMIALFPMVANTLFGLQSVEKSQRELFQLQKASRWTVLTKLQFPAALPSIFLGRLLLPEGHAGHRISDGRVHPAALRSSAVRRDPRIGRARRRHVLHLRSGRQARGRQMVRRGQLTARSADSPSEVHIPHHP